MIKNKMKKNIKTFLVCSLVMSGLIISGCGPKFSCTENLEGIKCDPPSKVYERYLYQESMKVSPEIGNEGAVAELRKFSKTERAFIDTMQEKVINKPLRVPPKIIKIWIAPWEDGDGDLHGGEVIFSEISPTKGRWILGEKDKGDLKFEIENANVGIDLKEALPEKVTTEGKSSERPSKSSPTTSEERRPQTQQSQPKVKKE